MRFNMNGKELLLFIITIMMMDSGMNTLSTRSQDGRKME